MDYRDYQKASLKHLTTCKLILESINLYCENGSAFIDNDFKKKTLLHNLFYLSGYTLECIINYSIFKHFKWKESESIYLTNHTFSNKCQVSFYENTGRTFGRGNYTFWLSGHHFQRNIEVLKKEFSGSKIPLIDRTVDVDKDLIKLYNSWKVEIRYNPSETQYSSVSLTFDNVKRFIALTEVIYNSLMKLVG